MQVPILEAAAAPRASVGKREAILVAATRVFLQHGYEGTSMDLVAQEAGVVRRTLYNQFPNGKEALFHAVVEQVWSAFPVLDITTDADALADPKLGLTRIGRAVADFWAPPMAVSFLRLVTAEGPRFPKLTESFFAAGKTPAMGAIRSYLEELSHRRILRIADAELATRQFLGLIDEPLLWIRIVGRPEETTVEHRTTVVEQAVAMFLGHYLPNPKTARKR